MDSLGIEARLRAYFPSEIVKVRRLPRLGIRAQEPPGGGPSTGSISCSAHRRRSAAGGTGGSGG